MKGKPIGEYRSKLEGQITFILMKAGVTGPEIDECIEWAFGKGAWYRSPWPEWVKYWNKHHGRLFEGKRRDNFVEFMYVVGFFFAKKKFEEIIKLHSN